MTRSPDLSVLTVGCWVWTCSAMSTDTLGLQRERQWCCSSRDERATHLKPPVPMPMTTMATANRAMELLGWVIMDGMAVKIKRVWPMRVMPVPPQIV